MDIYTSIKSEKFNTSDEESLVLSIYGRILHALTEYEIPEHCHEGILYYVFYGIKPGGFLSAVFMNDLAGAALRADYINKNRLVGYVRLMNDVLPSGCWGSYNAVHEWKGIVSIYRDDKKGRNVNARHQQ